MKKTNQTIKCLITFAKVTLMTRSIEDNCFVFSASHLVIIPAFFPNFVHGFKIDREYTLILKEMMCILAHINNSNMSSVYKI